jgi:hypothetical protein
MVVKDHHSKSNWLFPCAVIIIITVIVAMSIPPSVLYKARTMRKLTMYKHALIVYHRQYGCYPIQCETVVQLLALLKGQNLRGDNPEEIDFFCGIGDTALDKKPTLDGWGHMLFVKRNNDGKNLIVRSLGKNGQNDGGKYDDMQFDTASLDPVH